MSCPYCAAFGRDLFGQASLAGSAIPEGGCLRGERPAGDEAPDDDEAFRADEPSWPVTSGHGSRRDRSPAQGAWTTGAPSPRL